MRNPTPQLGSSVYSLQLEKTNRKQEPSRANNRKKKIKTIKKLFKIHGKLQQAVSGSSIQSPQPCD